MKSELSEFSYGFALTHELATSYLDLVATPRLPTLRNEGASGGYDVELPARSWALFLQFKVAQHMLRRNAIHFDDLGSPHYRFPIRPSSCSQQHELLISLSEEVGSEHVHYVVPLFHEIDALDQHFRQGQVATSSLFLPVDEVGRYDDVKEHWVAFGIAGMPVVVTSEPRTLRKSATGGAIAARFRTGLAESDPMELSDARLDDLARRLAATADRVSTKRIAEVQPPGNIETALGRLDYVVRMRYDAALCIIPGHSTNG
jgi:hypothetical protein